MANKDIKSVPFFADERPQTVIENGSRLDGRSFEEFRSVSLQTGVISQASGSAYVELGKTKVMVGVYGPRQSDKRVTYSEEGRLNCDVKYATFATRRRGKLGQSTEERDMSSTLSTALEGVVRLSTFPKASLDIFCTILEADGSQLAATITAAAVAVADSGVEMTDIITACEISRIQGGGGLLLDPSADESYREDAGMLLALGATDNKVTQLVCRGQWSSTELQEGLELAMGGCSQLDGAVRQRLVESSLD